MRRALLIIISVASLLVMTACGRGRVIPMNKFAAIYADMCLADQWLNQHPKARAVADTTRFYDAVFHKHGYNYTDYKRSVAYYLDYPEKYVRIIQRADAILVEGQKKAQDRLERQNLQQQNASPAMTENN